MTYTRVNLAYEVVLGPAAIRTIRSMSNADLVRLATALRTELSNSPNASNEIRFDSDVRTYEGADADAGPGGAAYTATPLSFGAYTAIHRPMTDDEISQLRREQSGPIADQGFYLIDILPAEAAFSRGPLLL